jgi:hypothetical protein
MVDIAVELAVRPERGIEKSGIYWPPVVPGVEVLPEPPELPREFCSS